jgi:hypothetical protein
MPKATNIAMHNTRLFPKYEGADGYRLTGIAARCDWAIMTDSRKGHGLVLGDLTQQPRTVFLSLRSNFHAIPYFYKEVLPRIENRFVLITGSEDITIPNQVDARWRPFNAEERDLIIKILSDDRVIHWFAENRDEVLPKMSTMPVGYVFVDGSSNTLLIEPPQTSIKDRPLKMLCAHRTRGGPQWETRRGLTKMCIEQLPDCSTVFADEISEVTFKQQVQAHPFVLCAQGGGLDPSPKAWFCIANGSIPIIKSSVLDDAYTQLPVARVNEWSKDSLSLEKLLGWIDEFSPFFDNQQLRTQTLHKLSLDYWWSKVIETLTSDKTLKQSLTR